jgi:hypothetical protein
VTTLVDELRRLNDYLEAQGVATRAVNVASGKRSGGEAVADVALTARTTSPANPQMRASASWPLRALLAIARAAVPDTEAPPGSPLRGITGSTPNTRNDPGRPIPRP